MAVNLKYIHHVPDLRNPLLKEIYDQNPDKFKQWMGTRIHNTWRSCLYTVKGKSRGFPEEWRDFFRFIEDVQVGYAPDKLMQRFDQKLPPSKDNYKWVDKSEVYSRKTVVTLEWEGELHTLKDLSDKYGSSVSAMKYRLSRGFSVQDAIFGKPLAPKKKVVCQHTLDTQKTRNKASRMISSYRHSDKKKGYDFDLDVNFILREVFPSSCLYCGSLSRLGCDRVDNNKGHTKDNVVVACYSCNTLRKDLFSVEEMKKIGKFLRENIYSEREDYEEFQAE